MEVLVLIEFKAAINKKLLSSSTFDFIRIIMNYMKIDEINKILIHLYTTFKFWEGKIAINWRNMLFFFRSTRKSSMFPEIIK